jgi:hypothetical protein
MRVMHATARAAFAREAHALERGPSSPPLSLAVEMSVANFDQPETWSPNGYKSQRIGCAKWQNTA